MDNEKLDLLEIKSYKYFPTLLGWTMKVLWKILYYENRVNHEIYIKIIYKAVLEPRCLNQ